MPDFHPFSKTVMAITSTSMPNINYNTEPCSSITYSSTFKLLSVTNLISTDNNAIAIHNEELLKNNTTENCFASI